MKPVIIYIHHGKIRGYTHHNLHLEFESKCWNAISMKIHGDAAISNKVEMNAISVKVEI
jgi:hypothetical protein